MFLRKRPLSPSGRLIGPRERPQRISQSPFYRRPGNWTVPARNPHDCAPAVTTKGSGARLEPLLIPEDGRGTRTALNLHSLLTSRNKPLDSRRDLPKITVLFLGELTMKDEPALRCGSLHLHGDPSAQPRSRRRAGGSFCSEWESAGNKILLKVLDAGPLFAIITDRPR